MTRTDKWFNEIKIMDRSDLISVGVTLVGIFFFWYFGGAKAAIICGVLGAIILAAVIVFRRDKKPQQQPAHSSLQSASPVVTQIANPTINVNVPNQSQPPPTMEPVLPPPKPQPNIKFVESRPVEVHAGGGEFYESPQGLGDHRVVVACFRNDGIVGQEVDQPHVRGQIIFRDSEGREIADVAKGVWLQEYKDAVYFPVGAKQCLILLLLTRQGTLKRLWKYTYTTEHSWMGGPSFAVGDAVISERIAMVEINLLESTTGTCVMQVLLGTEESEDGQLPRLALKSVRTT